VLRTSCPLSLGCITLWQSAWMVSSAGGCKYALGWCFTTIICEQRPYLHWLQDRVLRAGVTLQQRSITSLQASPSFSQSSRTSSIYSASCGVHSFNVRYDRTLKVQASGKEFVDAQYIYDAGAHRIQYGGKLLWPGRG